MEDRGIRQHETAASARRIARPATRAPLARAAIEIDLRLSAQETT
jgi:hypothetical protein